MAAIDDLRAAVSAQHDVQQRSLAVLLDLKARADANPNANDPEVTALAASLNADTTQLSKALDVATSATPPIEAAAAAARARRA